MPRNPLVRPDEASNRYYALNQAQGLVTATFDHRGTTANVQATASGQMRVNAAPVLQGDVITGLAAYNANTGVGASLVRLGIWDQNGVLLGTTGDLTGSLGSGVWISGALAAPISINYTGLVYLGLIILYVTTAPTMIGATSNGNTFYVPPFGPRVAYTVAAQADLVSFNTGTAGNGTQTYLIVAY